MTAATVAVLGALLFAWAILSGLLSRHNVTGPLAFLVVGYLLGNPDWGVLTVDVDSSVIHDVAEATLALVLFSDAARINSQKLRADLGLPVRLLVVGLPLSILAGTGLAGLLFGGVSGGLALLVGAALAPTDAALSATVIEDERIPLRLRRALNVESGLNDGIATPVVSVPLAAALGAVAGGAAESYDIQTALRELGAGALVGAVVGTGGAMALNLTARRGWIGASGRRLAAFGLAVTAFAAAIGLDGNGFIAAFVAGLGFGAVLDRSQTDLTRSEELPELGGELMGLVVWFLFGAALVPLAVRAADPAVVGYAVLSLTVVRMVPVALALVGSGLDRTGVAFVAWFGPRGLASVVFAMLAVEELGGVVPESDRAVGAIVLTVLLSAVLHGVTARPGGRAYLRRESGPFTGEQPHARRGWFRADLA